MGNKSINGYSELKERISELKAEKVLREQELSTAFNNFNATFDPISIIKKSVRNLNQDQQLKNDVVKAGVNMGVNFVIDTVMGRRKSLKGFLSSVLLEKYSTLFIEKKLGGVLQGIGSIIKGTRKREF